MTDAKMLLLLENEIGQIVGRRLTRSENHDETRELLEQVKGIFPVDEADEWFIVSDNANAIRSLVASVFGSSSSVRQDPFHVVQRFTDKVKGKVEKKALSKQLHHALYSVDGELRPPGEMEEKFTSVLQCVSPSDISCSAQEWNGSTESNIKQIQRGDLFVKSNVYSEGGGKDVRIVSTSQLEGFHSALKTILARSVSGEVGLRILDLFILQHNLKIGSKYGRNPPLQHADLLTLARTATLCRGVIPESPQLGFANLLMSKPLRQPAYRASTALDFEFTQWQQMFETAKIDTRALEVNLQRSRQHSTNIRELLAKQIAFTASGKLPKAAFFNSLCLTELDYEASAGFSGEEYTLLRQVHQEQKTSGQVWADCAMVTTIMYNIVVSSNSNHRLKLRRRSFATLSTKIQGLEAEFSSQPLETKPQQLFHFAPADVCFENSPREQELQIQLFTALRKMSGIRKRRQIFAMVYDFACFVWIGIHPKPRAALLARWDNLKHKSNQNANLKIKLKLTPAILSSIQPGKSCCVAAPVDSSVIALSRVERQDEADSPAYLSTNVQSSPPSPTIAPATTSINKAADSTNLGRNAHNQEATDSPPVKGTQQSNVLIQKVPCLPLALTPRCSAAISPEHLKMLRSLVDSIPNSNGKWEHIQAVYTAYYPHAPLSKNALRCRLKEKKAVPRPSPDAKSAAVTSLPAALSNETSSLRKRKTTSCLSCRQRKKKCGDLVRNPYCMQPNSTNNNVAKTVRLEHYFA